MLRDITSKNPTEAKMSHSKLLRMLWDIKSCPR